MRCNKRGNNKATTFWKADPSLGVVARRCDTRLREVNSACNSDMMMFMVVVGGLVAEVVPLLLLTMVVAASYDTTSVHRHGHGRCNDKKTRGVGVGREAK